MPEPEGRKPLPIGSWGGIRTDAVAGKSKRVRARAYYRDFDGTTRLVEANGRTTTQATQALRLELQSQAHGDGQADLTAMTRFSAAADEWPERLDDLVQDGRRSSSTADVYRRQLRLHVLPAMGEVRLGEITTPLVDRVLADIKRRIGPVTAKTSRSAR